MKLTDAQSACPGAGKTRAMVARFLKRTAEEPRRGIALISFTNAAVDEVRRRCGNADAPLRRHVRHLHPPLHRHPAVREGLRPEAELCAVLA
ncbi:UvrD-helicase domain-containing protein [Streptomyces sp. cf124]|uniref:UvrD-helicase domain-containing protein n=1 Tax=Streptomyces sp. cf124 TaxID=1761903 RepID=UPI003528B997